MPKMVITGVKIKYGKYLTMCEQTRESWTHDREVKPELNFFKLLEVFIFNNKQLSKFKSTRFF